MTHLKMRQQQHQLHHQLQQHQQQEQQQQYYLKYHYHQLNILLSTFVKKINVQLQ